MGFQDRKDWDECVAAVRQENPYLNEMQIAILAEAHYELTERLCDEMLNGTGMSKPSPAGLLNTIQ